MHVHDADIERRAVALCTEQILMHRRLQPPCCNQPFVVESPANRFALVAVRFALTLFALVACAFPANGQQRTWSDSSAKYSVQAELIQANDETALLKKSDGQTIAVPLDRLSDADRAFIAMQRATRGGDGTESRAVSEPTPEFEFHHIDLMEIAKKDERFMRLLEESSPELKHPVLWTNVRIMVEEGAEGYFVDPATVYVRSPFGKDVRGRVITPLADADGLIVMPFEIAASGGDLDHRSGFVRAKIDYYERQAASSVPGTPWFWNQSHALRAEHGLLSDTDLPAPTSVARQDEDLSTYGLFTGSRAVAENLQLNRNIEVATKGSREVPVSRIEGITIPSIDWNPLVAGKRPALDPLATLIPVDQHAVFFKSIREAALIADKMDSDGTILMRALQPRSQDHRVFDRYGQQLCLTINDLRQLLTADVAISIALTGSDIDFVTGTDIAILIESPDAKSLTKKLLRTITAATRDRLDATALSGETHGVGYWDFRTPDRRVSCYVSVFPEAVCITNSLYQLQQIAMTSTKRANSLAASPEYVFFRDRYRIGNAEETAFAMLTDATIRRWCGPRWRIAAARRIRQMATMLEAQASVVDALAAGDLQQATARLEDQHATLKLGPSGIMTTGGDTLDFMTPIAEMEMNRVWSLEASAYRRWRQQYERSWLRRPFDPIALRVSVSDDRLATDLSVIPLMLSSDYQQFLSFTEGTDRPLQGGDLHHALIHFAVAINRNSQWMNIARISAFQMLRSLGNDVDGELAQDSLSWFGGTIEIFFDDNSFWDELANVGQGQLAWLQREGHRVPVAVRLAVTDGEKLGAFLEAVRSVTEKEAPGTFAWETRMHRDEPYFQLSLKPKDPLLPPEQRGQRPIELEKIFPLYYSAFGEALVVSPNEEIVQQSLERRQVRQSSQPEVPMRATQEVWLGDNVGLRIDPKLIDRWSQLFGTQFEPWDQSRSWSNLPILNEWKRRYPEKDPVVFHERVWKTRLICPGGGEYVWNDEWQTMESTVYGHPGEPKSEPTRLFAKLRKLQNANFGLTFEHDGLRARVVVEFRDEALDSGVDAFNEPNSSVRVPELNSPAPGAELDNGRADRQDSTIWEFSWRAVEGADEYELFVIGANATSPVIRTRVGATSYREERVGGYIIERHRRGWRWRVRAYHNGVPGEWSDFRLFDVEPMDSDAPQIQNSEATD